MRHVYSFAVLLCCTLFQLPQATGQPTSEGESFSYQVSLSMRWGDSGEAAAFAAPPYFPLALKSNDGQCSMMATATRTAGSARGAQVTFGWEFLEEVSDREVEAGEKWFSLARRRITRPGRYRIRVTPAVNGVEDFSESKTIYIQAFDISLHEVQLSPIRMTPEDWTPDGRPLLWTGSAYRFEVETAPEAFGWMVEWRRGGKPLGTGPSRPIFFREGQETEITARLPEEMLRGGVSSRFPRASRWPRRPSLPGTDFTRRLDLVAVETRIVRQPTLKKMLSGEPVTYRAITIPSGHEDMIQWEADTHGGMSGTASPETGTGPRFTTSWDLKEMGEAGNRFYWFEVRANQAQLGGDVKVDGTGSRIVEQPPACNAPVPCDPEGIEGDCGCIDQCRDVHVNQNRTAAFYGGSILPHSGQEVRDETDLSFKGRDAATHLRIMRRHLSRVDQANSIFGPAWAFNYRHAFRRTRDGDIEMFNFGRTDLFTRQEDDPNVWLGGTGRFDRLAFDGENTTTLRRPGGTKLIFHTESPPFGLVGHLTAIVSPNNNRI
ncbi:MAG: DUF6531 domain-containing protein, partial [Acidobacteriota bacterium]